MKTDINKWTRKQFLKLPSRKWLEDIGIFHAMIILPQRTKHSSGYRCMDFVAVGKDGPICRLSGCSDIIHIDGIAGFGFKWLEKYGECPKFVPPSGWSIDCLYKSGLLRIWPGSGWMRCDLALSSFEIYREEKKI